MAKKVTIAEVAKAAGVSTATVSYILNDTPGHSFTSETIQRVNDVLKQLQYERSSALHRLRVGNASKGLICLAYAPNSDRVHQTAGGCIDELAKAGYDVVQLRLSLDETADVPLYNESLMEVMDGIIFLQAGGLALAEQWANLVIERRIPFVTTDYQWSRDISSVEFDYLDGAYQLTKRILEADIRRIYHFYMPYDAPQIKEQTRGIRRAVFESGREIELIDQVDPMFEMQDHAEACLLEAMPALDEQTAILMGYKEHTQYPLKLCLERGLSCPIGSFELGALDSSIFPQLCYSVLPLYEMGVAAAKALMRQLEQPTAILHEVLKPILIR